MNDEYLTTISENAKIEVRNVINKLLELRIDGNLKAYRNLSDSLLRLIYLFETNLSQEKHTADLISTRMKYGDLNFIFCLIHDLEVEINSLNKKMNALLSENDFYNHRDCIISYEKIIGLRNRLAPLYEFQIKLHKQ